MPHYSMKGVIYARSGTVFLERRNCHYAAPELLARFGVGHYIVKLLGPTKSYFYLYVILASRYLIIGDIKVPAGALPSLEVQASVLPPLRIQRRISPARFQFWYKVQTDPEQHREKRALVLERAFENNPERFVRGIITEVWINKPLGGVSWTPFATVQVSDIF